MKSEQRKAYTKYINSAKWKALRKSIILRDGRKCRLCGARSSSLEVHHQTYARFGNELPEDLMTLCAACHTLVHKINAHLPRELNHG